MKIQKVALLGLGAVGCTVAPGIFQTVGRENFHVIASGSRKKRLEEEGKVINGTKYFFKVSDVQENLEEDLIIVAVKAHQLEQAVVDIRSHVGENTVIMSLMNGISSEEVFAREYGKEKVLYSLTNISAQIRDGGAYYTLDAGMIKLGEERNEEISSRVKAVTQLLEQAEIPFVVPKDMRLALWEKYIFNVSNNAVAAVLHARHFYFQRLDAANRARKTVLREAQAVALAKGIPITEKIIEECMFYSEEYPADGYCSMVQDVEAGRHTEKEIFLGELIRMANEEKVEVPVSRFLYDLLQAIEDAADQGRKEHLR